MPFKAEKSAAYKSGPTDFPQTYSSSSRAEGRRQQREQRKSQRRLEQLIADDEAAGVGSIDDKLFFERHPERQFRMRLATTNEVETMAELAAGRQGDADQRFYWMIIKQLAPGVRWRVSFFAPLPPVGCSPADIPEEIARDLFEMESKKYITAYKLDEIEKSLRDLKT